MGGRISKPNGGKPKMNKVPAVCWPTEMQSMNKDIIGLILQYAQFPEVEAVTHLLLISFANNIFFILRLGKGTLFLLCITIQRKLEFKYLYLPIQWTSIQHHFYTCHFPDLMESVS